MASVFISYRSDDSAATCGRIYDRLVAHFGREAIFKDVDSIPLGVDFGQYIGGVMLQCAALLVVIGPQWLDMRDAGGARRLDDANDTVRLEVEAGLRRGIVAIPVLVQGAVMPAPESLPPSIRELAMRNGMAVRYDPDFDGDMRKVIAALDQWVAPRGGSPAFLLAAGGAQQPQGYPVTVPPAVQTGIAVTLRHNQLNVFYEMTTPTVAIDGREYRCTWGTHVSPRLRDRIRSLSGSGTCTGSAQASLRHSSPSHQVRYGQWSTRCPIFRRPSQLCV